MEAVLVPNLHIEKEKPTFEAIVDLLEGLSMQIEDWNYECRGPTEKFVREFLKSDCTHEDAERCVKEIANLDTLTPFRKELLIRILPYPRAIAAVRQILQHTDGFLSSEPDEEKLLSIEKTSSSSPSATEVKGFCL